MKKTLMIILLVTLAFNICSARKRDKAGKIEDGIYYDKEYNFSLVVPDGWNTSIKKADSEVRLILTKDQYDIPIHFQHAPNYTKVPKVTVYVGDASMRLDWFVDSLLSDDYNSDQKKDMLNEFELLFGDYINTRRSKMTIGDVEGYLISGERRYTIQVQRAGSQADKADVVTDYYAGSLFLTEHDGKFIIFHFICERLYYKMLENEFLNMLKGFKFTDTQASEEG